MNARMQMRQAQTLGLNQQQQQSLRLLQMSGVELEKTTLDAMVRPLTMTADTVDAVMANKPVHFSWQELLAGEGGGEANSKRNQIRPAFHLLPSLST